MIFNTLRCLYLLRKVGIKVKILQGLKKRFLRPIFIKVGCLTTGLLVSSYNTGSPSIVYIEAVWCRNNIFTKTLRKDMLKILFGTFLSTYDNTFKVNDIEKLILVVKLDVSLTSEDLNVLDIFGFHPDPLATMDSLPFTRPWREKEKISCIVFSRKV